MALWSHNSGKRINLSHHELNLQHFEHQYAVITHNAQGISANSVIMLHPIGERIQLIEEAFLVVAIRAKDRLLVVTENLAKLKSSLSHRYVDNTIALRNQEVEAIHSTGISN